MFLAGTLGSSWFAVLEALQNADYVLTTRGTAPPSSATLGPNTGATSGTPIKRGGTLVEGGGQQQLQQLQQQSRQQAVHPLLADLDPESVQAAIQRLFDASVILEDSAFHDFVGALCKLSLEMVSMQSGTDVGTSTAAGEGTLDTEDDTIPSASTSATSLVTPRTELFSRRRVSGIHIPRTLLRSICTRHRQTFSLD
jgi:protein MON2